MDKLYTVILQFLNEFFPVDSTSWGSLNELAAYLITWLLVYKVIVKPLIQLIDVIIPSKRR